MSAKLSLIMPVAPKRLNNVRLVLTSIQAQILPKDQFEVILVNDGGEHEVIHFIEAFPELDIRYIWTPKFEPNMDRQPRNKGALLARHNFLLFVDSDIILRNDALQLYIEGIEHDPNRVIAGIYHWLGRLNLHPNDIVERFDDIINEKIPYLASDGSHNVCRDMRLKGFQKHEPTDRIHDEYSWLGAFSGNIMWPRDIFWDVKGFWNALRCGFVEDGAIGLAAYFRGHHISFDKRIIGGHLWHPRDLDFLHKSNAVEVPLIEKRFKMGQYADGTDPDALEDIFTLSEENAKRLEIDGWKKG
jgi:glycosyltransferase involved in cell wall biosynthesis